MSGKIEIEAATGSIPPAPDPGTECQAMAMAPPPGNDGDEAEKARRFRDEALPHLDDLYALARYLLRNASDADDAVQECCLRAFRDLDGFRGQAIKPWLMAILRNVCRAEFARRSKLVTVGTEADVADEATPMWQEAPDSAESGMLRQQDAETIRGFLASLPEQFREAIVLRDINDLSYREIAEVLDVPVGTVMSRLARARDMLRQAWLASDREVGGREVCGKENKEQSR